MTAGIRERAIEALGDGTAMREATLIDCFTAALYHAVGDASGHENEMVGITNMVQATLRLHELAETEPRWLS